MAAITCESVTKIFKPVTVLDDITLNVEENTIFGVFSPDSSGKTTLTRLLTGLLKPTSGLVSLFDENVSKNPEKALEHTGCLVGEPVFYERFTAGQILQWVARLVDANADDVKESTRITFDAVKTEHLTRAMKKQLGIALALLGNPRLLLLDEPLTALPPAVRTQIIQLLQSKETTIFYTTSNPDDIKELATEAAVLQQGKITLQGSAQTLNLEEMEP
jgi:ABC-2 type transport system ATP-binding protein